MKTLSRPQEFTAIHVKHSPGFLKITSNMEMRKFISSFGFRASREIAAQVIEMRNDAATNLAVLAR